MKQIYLDNSATTKLSSDVISAMANALNIYGNASSLHNEGYKAKLLIEESRNHIAKLIGSKPNEIVFNSGGTESNNTIINIAQNLINNNKLKNEIVVSSVEHPSIIEPAKILEKNGYKVLFLPVNRDGRIDINKFKNILNAKTAFVSIMHANNETGVIQDIKTITKLAHRFNALVHTDAVQTLGKINFNVLDLDVDYASFSAHKIYGPKGVGALYIKNKIPYKAFITGGHQENNKRAGTYNTIGIVGFGQAAKNALITPKKYNNNIMPVKNKLRDEILNNIPNVIINGDQDNILPNVLNVSFLGAEGESILLHLDHYGIQTSTGSACASGDTKPSHVLMAMLNDPELAHGSIRFSFSLENTTKDVDYVIKYLPNIVKNLREISTIRTGENNE